MFRAGDRLFSFSQRFAQPHFHNQQATAIASVIFVAKREPPFHLRLRHIIHPIFIFTFIYPLA